jgi:TetR/AcrR family transcriptional regulator, transcriptional repressor for nem operon
MRRSQEDAAKTRARIVDEASRLFRARGIDATSVADVMSAAGLTVGGFYRHFESKEDLVVEAIDAASRETADRHLARSASEDGNNLLALFDTYLSDAHRKHPGLGCPVAALCSEVAHGSKTTKRAFTGALERLLTGIGAAGGPSSKADRASALFAASAAVGAVVLARATHDESLARELLSAARERLVGPSGGPPG